MDEKLNYRGFFITINSNQPIQNVKNEYAPVIKSLFGSEFTKIAKNTEGVKEVVINYANETAARYGAAHSHALVEFYYTGAVKPKFDYNDARNYLKEKLNLSGVRLQNEFVNKDERDDTLRYIYKDQPNKNQIYAALKL